MYLSRAVEQATQATTRENLSSGSPTKRVSNQSASWKIEILLVASLDIYDSSQKADNRVADETARVHRLVFACIVTNHRTQVFSVAVQWLYVSFRK